MKLPYLETFDAEVARAPLLHAPTVAEIAEGIDLQRTQEIEGESRQEPAQETAGGRNPEPLREG